MAPQFALSLSQDGIDLLRKDAGEWQVVAQADPSSPDLPSQMEALQNTAQASTAEPVAVNIILPDDQVKYLSLETGGLDENARTALTVQTLEETTPYAADEIVFDQQPDGDTTHVAAIAVETLTEAKSFARQYGFVPLAYLAQPFEGRTFAIEPVVDALKSPADMTASIAALKQQASPETRDEKETDRDTSVEPEVTEATEFVSRRRVPTFRTAPVSDDTPKESEAASFAEPASEFEGTPQATAKSGAAQPPALEPGKARARNEHERMTVFGTRSGSGIRQGIGPIGTGIAIACVAALGLVAFASSALGTNVVTFFALLNAPKPTAQFTAPLQPQITANDVTAETGAEIELASLNTTLSDEDQAVLDALRAPVLDAPTPRSDRTTDEVRAAYAVTGIWPLAPDVPTPPSLIAIDNLYQTSVDQIEMNFDAVALPALTSYRGDAEFLGLAAPAPAGTTFALDDRGLVIPTPEGALNPDGIAVFAGPPPLRQPSTLLKIEEPGQDLAKRLRLAGFRPQTRPEDLIESNERAALGGLTRTELGQLRPRLRPESAQESALAAASLVPLEDGAAQPLVPTEDQLATATARAVPSSLRPDARPANFASVVEKAQKTKTVTPAPTQVAAANPAPRAVTPSIPSTASVARQATVKNALNLRKVNLIGVYGKPSSRRALVRLSNGRYRKVEVGDRIDGGRVSAIGDAELRYQKSGRDVVLKMPRS